MLPGADWNLSENTVWTESTMTSAGLMRVIVENALEARFREQIQRVADNEPLAAR